ncbi:F-box only protein 15-like isoform X1 [Osmerus mordax]|uniref:F-box only protein 15-like isoform X1 n=1 Tax=Osmerus mordax TaxID=8014 RepID=UPI0035104A12
MATGCGQFFRSFTASLKKNEPPIQDRGSRVKHNRGRSSKGGSKTVKTTMFSHKIPEARKSSIVPDTCAVKPTPKTCTQNHFLRMPPEILQKILSYLDDYSLLCIEHVSKLFNQLANNNDMWHQMYLSKYGSSKRWRPKIIEKRSLVKVQERSNGFWRRLYLRTMAICKETRWKRDLKDINPFTGLPSQTERVLRNLHVTWDLTLCDDVSGWRGTFEPIHVYFSNSSLTVCWSGEHWPSFCQTSLQLHGVKKSHVHGWRSLMVRLDRETISGSKQIIGSDKLVNLVFLPPGLLVGTWRGNSTIAFVIANFHFHRLVERSLLSSPFCSYAMPHFSDEDPSYDLHSYRLHIVLHNTVTQIMLGCFPQLSCEKGQIHGRYIYLTAIRKNEFSQHTPLSGKIMLPWRWGALQGSVENCCIMSLTLLDESQNPIWCVSTPVSMVLSCGKRMSRHYKGDHFLIRYQELEGKVKMKLVWLEEQKQFFLISLTLAITLAKVNRHFGTDATG